MPIPAHNGRFDEYFSAFDLEAAHHNLWRQPGQKPQWSAPPYLCQSRTVTNRCV